MSNSTNEMAVLNIVKNGVSSSYECIDQQARTDVAEITGNSKAISFTNGLTADTSGQTVSIGLDMTNASAGKYLKTDSNNQVTWGELSTEEVSRVHILSKTSGITTDEFDQLWSWLSNGHIVGVWRSIDGLPSLYIAQQQFTTSYGKEIVFVFGKTNPDWDSNENLGTVCYTGRLVRSSPNAGISFSDKVIIPSPINQFQKVLYTSGSGASSITWIDAFRITASNTTSFTAKSGQTDMLTVNSSRGYLGAGTDLHKYLTVDESNVTGESDDGKTVYLNYNSGNFKLGLKEDKWESAAIKSPFSYAYIGNRRYRAVTIGDYTWMAEDLDFAPEGITVGGTYDKDNPDAHAWYLNNNEALYGEDGKRYGLLYNLPAVEYLNTNKETLTPGWHIPDNSEWNNLIEAIGGQLEPIIPGSSTMIMQAECSALMRPGEWGSFSPSIPAPNNSLKFDAVPTRLWTGTQFSAPADAHIWSITIESGTSYTKTHNAHIGYFDNNGFIIYVQSNTSEFGYGIRLVKDHE